MHVAVLGGTLSGTVAARRLAQSGVRVDLFRNLNDPKRDISNVHPICEYQTATLVLKDDAPSEFKDEVQSWLDRGLAQDALDFWYGYVDAEGNARKGHSPGRRVLPTGGFFALLDSLMAALPSNVEVKPEQLVRMSRDAGKWWLRDRHGTEFGPYRAVMFAFDAIPRAARKASEKQLLETALPHTQSIIASAAPAQMCSSMTAVYHFDPPLDVPYDSILFENVPQLQFAARNPKDHQKHRGIRQKHDTWTVVATPAWSLEQRPISTGKWDKQRVGKEMERSFCKAMRCDPRSCRQVIPTFHWEGCSYISEIKQGSPCAFDSDIGVGWCGDMFGGQGPAGAFTSGVAAGELLASFAKGKRKSVLPSQADWGLREPKEGDEDTMSIAGPATGRAGPKDGLDHTWTTSVRLARGEHVQEADSYKRFRKHGPLGEDRFMHKEGPWSAPPARQVFIQEEANSRREQPLKLACEKIETGILKVTGLTPDVQMQLLLAVFPPGARGVCGGLFDAHRGIIQDGHGKPWSVTDGSKVPWSDLGLHGNHTVQLEALDGTVVGEVLDAIANAAGEVLEGFRPDSVRVAFENMGGRTIKPGQTLCGWSWDRDRVDGNDRDPKICIIVGSAKIWRGYKYSKNDDESLDVELNPGDVLVVYGPGRNWVSAVNGFEPQKSKSAATPFDFTHIWIQDHRRLQRLRPQVYDAIHNPPTPVTGGAEYKWMQFAYTVSEQQGCDGEPLVDMSGGDLLHSSSSHLHSSERSVKGNGYKGAGTGTSRRWKSSARQGYQNFEQLAGA